MAAGAERPLGARELETRARAWQPWRSYAVMHLWRAAADAGGRARRVRNKPVAACAPA
jgi:AraC family transcriptional regulator of adaptative response / DNA-3-methyladenine glycosylase II